jgi:signal transduction histidine kinase
MQWIYFVLIRIFDRKVKRDRRGPSSLDTFRKRAMKNICIFSFIVALVNGVISFQAGRYEETFGLEFPVGLTSLIGFFVVRRVQQVEWIAGIFMLVLSFCISFWFIGLAKSAYSSAYVWYPLIGFGAILLCGRRIGLIIVQVLFLQSMLVFLLNAQYGFVLTHGMSFEVFGVGVVSTMVSACLTALAIIAMVEVSRQRADRANMKANASDLRRASLGLLGDMALDISRNMQTPLAALQKMLEDLQKWDPNDTLRNRGPILIQNLNLPLQELGRLTQSLLIFGRTDAQREIVTLRALDFLQHLNELTREKAISRGVSLDFSADQPQATLQLPVAAALFALVSIVNKGVEAAAEQESAWVRLQLRYYDKQLLIRIADSGPSLSFDERRMIQKQTSSLGSWDVNLRMSLEFIASIGGTLSLDPYSPDTCFVLQIPLGVGSAPSDQAA